MKKVGMIVADCPMPAFTCIIIVGRRANYGISLRGLLAPGNCNIWSVSCV